MLNADNIYLFGIILTNCKFIYRSFAKYIYIILVSVSNLNSSVIVECAYGKTAGRTVTQTEGQMNRLKDGQNKLNDGRTNE